MKIKVIDLLNKIANGEEVPKEIEVICERFYCTDGLRFKNKDEELLGEVYSLDIMLDDTVKIIEEEPEIDIQALEEYKTEQVESRTQYEMRNYINRVIIPAIKQIDKKLKGE